MKERPILFSPPMVRAIVDGAKVVTRRVVKLATLKVHVPEYVPVHIPFVVTGKPSDMSIAPGVHRATMNDHGAVSVLVRGESVGVKPGEFKWASPYGVPGDRLYVAEAWSTPPGFGDWRTTDRSAIRYTSTDGVPEGWRRRHARFMPRKYARLVLDVVSVRVERLHAIDDADALREGVLTLPASDPGASPRERFMALWCEINGGASWASNPWVWRISFEVRRG